MTRRLTFSPAYMLLRQADHHVLPSAPAAAARNTGQEYLKQVARHADGTWAIGQIHHQCATTACSCHDHLVVRQVVGVAEHVA